MKIISAVYSRQPASWTFLLLILGLSLIIVSCAPSETTTEAHKLEEVEPVRIAYVEWASEIASSHVLQVVIEEYLGLDCELLPVSAISMWESVAAGDQDAMLGAWLPQLQSAYFERLKDDLLLLGPNMEGVEMGFVVPAYVTIESIAELSNYHEQFGAIIVGIDPEAGLMESSARAIETYNLENFELIPGSDATMTSALEIAIDEQRWIVVTGWTPHWKFARWNLKYLKDPENAFGESEYIGTVVRKGLEEERPDVFFLFDNFYWDAADMEQVMLWFSEEGMSIKDASIRWVDENRELVEKWVAP